MGQASFLGHSLRSLPSTDCVEEGSDGVGAQDLRRDRVPSTSLITPSADEQNNLERQTAF